MASTIYAVYRRQRRVPRFVRRCAEGMGTFLLATMVATQIAAQGFGAGASTRGGRFTSIPKPQDEGGDMILGIPANTIFFVAAGIIAVLWFTVGGGRKAKVTRKI